MAKVHSSLATTELHNPKGIGVESATEELLTMSASIGAVSASASMVPHTTDVFSLGTDSLRWTNVIASGNISSSLVSIHAYIFGLFLLVGSFLKLHTIISFDSSSTILFLPFEK